MSISSQLQSRLLSKGLAVPGSQLPTWGLQLCRQSHRVSSAAAEVQNLDQQSGSLRVATKANYFSVCVDFMARKLDPYLITRAFKQLV